MSICWWLKKEKETAVSVGKRVQKISKSLIQMWFHRQTKLLLRLVLCKVRFTEKKMCYKGHNVNNGTRTLWKMAPVPVWVQKPSADSRQRAAQRLVSSVSQFTQKETQYFVWCTVP